MKRPTTSKEAHTPAARAKRARRLRADMGAWMSLALAPVLGFLFAFWVLINGTSDWYSTAVFASCAVASSCGWTVCASRVRDCIVELMDLMIEMNTHAAVDRDE